jgi:single-stranded-DNA-specific exonuclease
VLDASEVSEALYRELEQVAPFGRKNPEPVFLLRAARFARPARTFGTNHFKLFLQGADGECEAVAFGMADRPLPRDGCTLAGVLDWSDYTGGIQVRILDWCEPGGISTAS